MRKITRASIMLIAIGVLLIPEAYMAHAGESSGSGVVRRDSPVSSSMLFLWRGQTLEGNIKANASLNFYVMDETNYLDFASSNSWQPLMALLDVSNESLNFVAPTSGYYRTVAIVERPQENVELTTSLKFYGIDLDHYQSGIAFVAMGGILIVIDAIRYLKSKSSKKPPAE